MHPILVTFGTFEVRAYGLMLMISFIVGFFLARNRAQKVGVDQTLILHASFFILMGAIVGSRLLFVGENLSSFLSDPVQVLNISGGGLSMYGGIILAIVLVYAYVRVMGESFAKVADIFAPSLALGVFITRIGCFFNGCCFGKVCFLPWAN